MTKDWKIIDADQFIIEDEYGNRGIGGLLESSDDERQEVRSLPGTHLWTGRSTECPLIPEERWTDSPNPRGYEWRDVNQNPDPSCALASAANQVELSRERDGWSRTAVDFRAAWIALTRGRGGAALSRVSTYLQQTGFAAVGVPNQRIKNLEDWWIDGYDHRRRRVFQQTVASAIEIGYFVQFGHDGHAEVACGKKKINGVWYLDTRNTWGKNWYSDGSGGRTGWHWFPLSRVDYRYDARAVRSIELTPGDLVAWEAVK